MNCEHCGWPTPDKGWHLPAGAQTPELQVGQAVKARMATAVCEEGEAGVVIETYSLASRAGWSVLFSNGGIDGWSPCEVELMLVVGDVETDLAEYTYRDRGQVYQDWNNGLFASAFARAETLQLPTLSDGLKPVPGSL